jgi:uncharacterized phage-associated protein
MNTSNPVYDPLAVANFFVQKSLETGKEVTPMKLLKLVYIAHGWNLGLFGEPLISEAVEAWQYGPVIPSVYQAFKEYGRSRITKMTSGPWGASLASPVVPVIPEEDTRTRGLLNEIWDVYGDKDGLYLSAVTHKEGSPWTKTERNGIIAQETIREHYQSMAQTAA